MDYTYEDIAKMVDHSLLNPTLTWSDLECGLRVSKDYNTASACIMPFAVGYCAEYLAGTTVYPSTTIGFPHGLHTTQNKVAEVETAITQFPLLGNVAKYKRIVNLFFLSWRGGKQIQRPSNNLGSLQVGQQTTQLAI